MFKACIYSFSKNGAQLAETISGINDISFRGDKCTFINKESAESLQNDFLEYDGIIFIGAIGIAVRKIAPLINSKKSDPAVIVIDEAGEFVIPILSGHIGGANGLSKSLADVLKAQTVITTATDVNGYVSIDEIAASNGMEILNINNIKLVNSKILDERGVNVFHDDFIESDFGDGKVYARSKREDADVIISAHRDFLEDGKLYIFNKRIVVGVGCRKNIAIETFEKVINSELAKLNVTQNDIDSIVSIDLKAIEDAILKYCEKYNISFKTYSANELNSATGDFDESEFVKGITGVSNVSERAAAFAGKNGRFLLKRNATDGVTVSVFEQIKRIDFNGKA